MSTEAGASTRVRSDDQRRSARALIGTCIGGYLLTRVMGRGAACVVYRARDLPGRRDVALKALFEPCSEVHVERLARERRATSHVDHTHVVKSLDDGAVPGRLRFVVLELVEGETLHERLCRGGPEHPARALSITRQLADGLAAIHASGYVHRDLKPSNVMVAGVAHPRAKIIDLGIAGIPALGHRERMRCPDSMLGTPAYMAPEQVETPFVGPSADLYALGAVLWHMLAGRPPFEGSTMELAAQHLIAPPPPLPTFGGLGALARRLLAKSPAERPGSAREVAGELERLEAFVAA